MERKTFVAELRTALMQLDDLQSLRANPLLPLLPSHGEQANPVALQRALMEAVEALKSSESIGAARAHEVLSYRYLDQLNQEEVAFQLGVSVRQLRREQVNALEFLADQLWIAWGLAQAGSPIAKPAAMPPAQTEMQKELAWLRNELRAEPSEVAVELQKAVAAVAPLAERYQAMLQVDAPSALRAASLPPPILRQALVTVMTVLIPKAAKQTLSIQYSEQMAEQTIRFRVQPNPKEGNPSEEWTTMLQAVSQLLTPFNGQIYAVAADALVQVRVPSVASTPILLIDDNPDVRQLFQRYVANSRFQLLEVGDLAGAVELAQSLPVRGLILDIMMPEVDGWDILSQWRHHPVTQQIPVAVCTILPQEELAQILGAALFIQKPVEQATFLQALETLIASPAVLAERAPY